MKTVSGRGLRAIHFFHSPQVFKTHTTPVVIIDYAVAHRFCMIASMRDKREQYLVKWRCEKYVMVLALRAAAIL